MNDEEQRIREFAYQIWQAEGQPDGQAERHWQMARKLAESEVPQQQPSPPARRVNKPKEVPLATQDQGKAEKPALLKKPRTTAKAPASKAPKA